MPDLMGSEERVCFTSDGTESYEPHVSARLRVGASVVPAEAMSEANEA
jgi:hypothetical protein